MKDFSREEKPLESLAPPRFAGRLRRTFPRRDFRPTQPIELAKMKAEDLGVLNGYGWVDRKAGIAHIPIDRAIDIVAEKGFPFLTRTNRRQDRPRRPSGHSRSKRQRSQASTEEQKP